LPPIRGQLPELLHDECTALTTLTLPQLNELVCLPAACQRVFFGKKGSAAETVWLACRIGACSPNRQFLAEPFEDVLRRGRCSEVCIRGHAGETSKT
jgi:hypothetical protein